MSPSWKQITQGSFAILLICFLIQPHMAVAKAQTARHAELADFTAILTTPGIDIEWQATGPSVDWQFTLYRSQSCQFDGAQEVVAPIFSSINDEEQVVYYSLTDTEEPVITTCAYWLVATTSDGPEQHYGPYMVQGRTTVYLPLAWQ